MRPGSGSYVAMMGAAVTLGVRELLAEPCDLYLECAEGRAVRTHSAVLALASPALGRLLGSLPAKRLDRWHPAALPARSAPRDRHRRRHRPGRGGVDAEELELLVKEARTSGPRT